MKMSRRIPKISRLRGLLLFAFALVGVLSVPSIVTGDYWQEVLIIATLNVTLAMTLNLVVGYTGLLALGHGAFFGVGAYTSAILTTTYELPFWPSFLIGGLVAGLCGLMLAIATLRLRGHYLAIATLSFAVIVYAVLMNWISVTRGPQGLPGISGPPDIPLGGGMTIDFSTKPGYFYLAGLFAIVCYYLLKRIIKSPIGDALTAVREDEISAQSLGIRTFAWKLFSFTVAAVLAGMTGALYAGYVGILEPDTFILPVSFTLLAMVIVGGSGTLLGPVLGALVLTTAPEALRDIGPDYRLIVYGLALTVTVLFFPQGLEGLGRWAYDKLRPRGSRRTDDEIPPTFHSREEVPVDAP